MSASVMSAGRRRGCARASSHSASVRHNDTANPRPAQYATGRTRCRHSGQSSALCFQQVKRSIANSRAATSYDRDAASRRSTHARVAGRCDVSPHRGHRSIGLLSLRVQLAVSRRQRLGALARPTQRPLVASYQPARFDRVVVGRLRSRGPIQSECETRLRRLRSDGADVAIPRRLEMLDPDHHPTRRLADAPTLERVPFKFFDLVGRHAARRCVGVYRCTMRFTRSSMALASMRR
jgi:hypothetical protein